MSATPFAPGGYYPPPRSIIVAYIASTLLGGWGSRVLDDDITRSVDDAEKLLAIVEARYGAIPGQQERAP